MQKGGSGFVVPNFPVFGCGAFGTEKKNDLKYWPPQGSWKVYHAFVRKKLPQISPQGGTVRRVWCAQLDEENGGFWFRAFQMAHLIFFLPRLSVGKALGPRIDELKNKKATRCRGAFLFVNQ